jgi:hypothetical protein
MGPANYRATHAPDPLVRDARSKKWLGEEGSNPHYQGQNLASYH